MAVYERIHKLAKSRVNKLELILASFGNYGKKVSSYSHIWKVTGVPKVAKNGNQTYLSSYCNRVQLEYKTKKTFKTTTCMLGKL